MDYTLGLSFEGVMNNIKTGSRDFAGSWSSPHADTIMLSALIWWLRKPGEYGFRLTPRRVLGFFIAEVKETDNLQGGQLEEEDHMTPPWHIHSNVSIKTLQFPGSIRSPALTQCCCSIWWQSFKSLPPGLTTPNNTYLRRVCVYVRMLVVLWLWALSTPQIRSMEEADLQPVQSSVADRVAKSDRNY